MVVMHMIFYLFFAGAATMAMGALLTHLKEDQWSEDTIIARAVLLGLIWPVVVAAGVLYGVYLLIFRAIPWVVINALPRKDPKVDRKRGIYDILVRSRKDV